MSGIKMILILLGFCALTCASTHCSDASVPQESQTTDGKQTIPSRTTLATSTQATSTLATTPLPISPEELIKKGYVSVIPDDSTRGSYNVMHKKTEVKPAEIKKPCCKCDLSEARNPLSSYLASLLVIQLILTFYLSHATEKLEEANAVRHV